MEKLLTVNNLNVHYGKVHVLKDISFEIKDVIRNGHVTGQIVAVLGASGCGKSTLFRVLSGLKDYTGEIELADIKEDKIINYIPPRAGSVGMVDQAYTMFRHKTVHSALSFALRNRDIKDKNAHIKKYATQVGIDHVLNKYPNELSGGQRQRAALLERLFNENHFIILDEPFSGLDVKSKVSAKTFIREIVNEHEFNTVLFCTHNINVAVEMADVILILSEDGRLTKQYNLREENYVYNQLTERHVELTEEIQNHFLK